MHHIARVHLVSAEERVARLDELHQRGLGLGVAEDDLYVWDAEVSNTLLDSYFTHMSESTLRNYADDAERGVAFLKGHDWKSLPIGYSLSGKLETNNDRQRVVAGFYTSRALSEAADLIHRMQTQLLRDVSVGFFGGRMICDICGNDFWECRHFPGLNYEEKNGDTVTKTLATFTIEDARLSEVSGVFDGSTPHAMILKAERAARAGELTPEQVRLLEHNYRVALPASASFASVAVPATPSVILNVERETKLMTEEELVRVRTLLNVPSEEAIPAAVEALGQALSDAQGRIKTLEPQAADGLQYRNDLIEEALSEGVRAQGNTFNRALYEETLRNSPIAVVKQMRDDWRRMASLVLPAGRKSSDNQEMPAKSTSSLIDDSAYRV